MHIPPQALLYGVLPAVLAWASIITGAIGVMLWGTYDQVQIRR